MSKSNTKGNQSVLSLLFLMVSAVLVIPMVSSCGKDSAASPTGLNTQLNIVNAGPDRFPIDFYINTFKQNTSSYTYGIPSGYFYVTSLATPLQLRTQTNTIIYSKTDSLSRNCKYSLFVTGLLSDKTDTTILTVDTAVAPALGRAKIRFVNASARAVNLDLYANSTIAFKNRGFVSVSDYVELPAGVYDFRLYTTGTKLEQTHLLNTTVQDGRLYTLYTRGVVGRTDSAAITTVILANK